MHIQITFPNTHGKDTALYALDYQRALLNLLALTVEQTDDPDTFIAVIALIEALGNTARKNLTAEKSTSGAA